MPLRTAMKQIADEGSGVLIILQGQESDSDIVRKLRQHQMRDQGIELPHPDHVHDLRYHGIGAQILADLGVHQMRVISAPKKTHGISGFGLEVTEYVTAE